MYFFAQGCFGREAEDKELLIVKNTPDEVSWITPWASCPGPDYEYGSKVNSQVSQDSRQ